MGDRFTFPVADKSERQGENKRRWETRRDGRQRRVSLARVSDRARRDASSTASASARVSRVAMKE